MELIYNYLRQLGAVIQVNKREEIPSEKHNIHIKSNHNFLASGPPRSILRRDIRYPSYQEGGSRLDSVRELQQIIIEETNEKTYDFISEFLDIKKNHHSIILNTSRQVYAENVDFDSLRAIVNIHLLNSVPDLNSYFRAINTLLPDAGVFIGRVQIYNARTKIFRKKYGSLPGSVVSLLDFFVNRVLPKVKPFNRLYHYLTKNKFNVLSKAEVLGRLVYSGFDIVECVEIDDLHYVVGMKTGEPNTESKSGSYFPIFKMQRVGKHGKMIGVYKFRTMHPYSEFIQDYVIRLNGYNDKGKPANDFRLTPWGKWMRRLWLDELPQIINLLKGDMKLVGVRPLSQARFNVLPKEVQEARVKQKPGCIPPYVSLRMPGDEENIEAEVLYLKEKEQQPLFTDVKYFVSAVYNILANRIRSA